MFLKHISGNRSDAGGGDFFTVQITQALDVGPRHEPLEHLIVESENGFERRIALGDRHQGAAAGAGRTEPD
jgi:hypothetical protein